MIGLTGVRVIVVDDKEEEALPVLKAFAGKGIPTAFFHAPRKNALPKKTNRLTGVRLAILDMDLVPGTISNATKAATLANYLGNILRPDNGPYAVLAWTYHPDIVERFEHYVFSSGDIPNPAFTVTLGKDQCFRNGKCNLSRLSIRLAEELGGNTSLKLFEAWEESCFAAATAVTNTLSDLAVPNSESLDQWRRQWRSQLLQLLYTIARAEAEEHLGQDTCVNAIYNSLNPLHADRMENQMDKLCRLLTDNSADIMSAAGNISSEQKAKLNTMLHLSLKDIPGFAMGNIYLFSGKRKPNWVPRCNDLLKGNWVQGGREETIDQNIREITQDSIPMLIEISAACDHAQNKIQRARLLGGMLVPAKHRSKLNRKAEFIREYGPFHLTQPVVTEDQYFFYFSSRQVVSLELDEIQKRKAAARLRNAALGDLQSWLAHQEARPGIVMLK